MGLRARLPRRVEVVVTWGTVSAATDSVGPDADAVGTPGARTTQAAGLPWATMQGRENA